MCPLFEVLFLNRKRIFLPLVLITIGIMLIMNIVGMPLNTPQAPSGIISFELAGNVAKMELILDSWDEVAQKHAAFSLGFDYLFMLFYALTIGLACLWSADVLRQRSWPLANLGVLLAWGLIIAALFDAVENLGLLICLLFSVVSPWPEIAKWCAMIKFSLVFAGLVFAFYGLVVRMVKQNIS